MVEFGTVEFWGMVVSVITVVIGVVFNFINNRYQRKRIQIISMGSVFKDLNSFDERDARRKLFYLHCKLHPNGKKLSDEKNLVFEHGSKFRAMTETTRTLFGQINVMLEDGLLNKKIFMRTYAGMVIRTWKVLEDEIGDERKITKNDDVSIEFEKLKNKAEIFFQKRGRESLEPYCVEMKPLDLNSELQDYLNSINTIDSP